MMTTSTGLRSLASGIALADTCARTVAGFAWTMHHMEQMQERAVPCIIMEDKPFRFGDGPRVHAICGMIICES